MKYSIIILISLAFLGCNNDYCDCQKITIKEEVYKDRDIIYIVNEDSDKCHDEELESRNIYYRTDEVIKYRTVYIQCN